MVSHAGEPSPIIDLLFQSSLDGVLAFDRDCRYTHWNPAMERLTNIPSTATRGNVAFDVFPFLKEIGEDRFFRLALAGESAVSAARPFSVPSTGKSGYFEGHYSPLRNGEGEVIGGMAIIRDISERVENAAELRFRALVEQAPFSIQLYSLDGQCTYANPAWERFWASRREELRNYNILEDPQAEANGLTPFLERAFRGEAVTFPDIDYDPAKIGKLGRRRWARGHFFPVRDSAGAIVEIAQVLEDITDTKHLEISRADLASALGAARVAVQVRDTFLSIASHELRTPVTLMKMQTQLAKRNIRRGDVAGLTPEHVEATVNKIDRSLDRLAKLVDQILDVARIQSGHLELEREGFELSELVVEVLEQFQPQLDAAAVEVRLDFQSKAVGNWDRHRIDQVVTNILSNVIRYASSAPLIIRLRLSEGFAFLEFRDAGPGIPPEDQDRIFNRFERLANPKTVGGLGLGLHITREVVNAHGGKIRVRSDVGEGSTFVVELPINPHNV